MKKKQPRIFIGPCEIAGYYANLAKGFHELGMPCDFISYQAHPFEYGGESQTPFLIRLGRRFTESRLGRRNSKALRAISVLTSQACFNIWGLLAIFRYDVFIFGFGQSLLRGNIDLFLLRVLRKKVIANLAHGSEARPPYIDGARQSKDGVYPSIEKILELTMRVKARVSRNESWASVVIGAPLSTSHFCRKKFVNWFAMGVPIQINRAISNPSVACELSKENSSVPIRILHSPSHPAAKGTAIIKEAIENLKKVGYAIDFILIHGKPVSDVIEEIKKCDFVVDQLYSDTPMAGFATEAAWFGKPSVVGGYGWAMLRGFVTYDMWPPSQICCPDDIQRAIECLIYDREERERLGQQAQVFVLEKWNVKAVAERFLRLIQDDIPDDWWLDPDDVCYLGGGLQPIEKTKENVKQMIDQFGIDSLRLSHRPDLEKAFLEFAGLKEAQS